VNDLPFGLEVTRGFGCGGDVAHGRQAAEQDIAALRQAVAGARVVVLVTGLGGGTGGGAAPVVAKLARDAGALVVTLATLPFGFEAPLRQANAKASLQASSGESSAASVARASRAVSSGAAASRCRGPPRGRPAAGRSG
jgi:cell division protein FtsZ